MPRCPGEWLSALGLRGALGRRGRGSPTGRERNGNRSCGGRQPCRGKRPGPCPGPEPRPGTIAGSSGGSGAAGRVFGTAGPAGAARAPRKNTRHAHGGASLKEGKAAEKHCPGWLSCRDQGSAPPPLRVRGRGSAQLAPLLAWTRISAHSITTAPVAVGREVSAPTLGAAVVLMGSEVAAGMLLVRSVRPCSRRGAPKRELNPKELLIFFKNNISTDFLPPVRGAGWFVERRLWSRGSGRSPAAAGAAPPARARLSGHWAPTGPLTGSRSSHHRGVCRT